VCFPTAIHADHVVRALRVGKDTLCELPLASTMADARRIVEAQQATGREVFVDMFSRFDAGVRFLLDAVADGRHGALKTLRWATRTARLWEGYDLGLDSIAMDMMHSSLDTIVAALGRPQSMTAPRHEQGRRRIGRQRPGRPRAICEDAVVRSAGPARHLAGGA
jgi:predicted dehydrogenase